MNRQELIIDLYKNAVDEKDVNHLATLLAENVAFRIANHDPIYGLENVTEANTNFFNSIGSMNHSIEQVITEGEYSVCHGRVSYIRLDGSKTSAVYSTVLRFIDNKISEYKVFADISAL